MSVASAVVSVRSESTVTAIAPLPVQRSAKCAPRGKRSMASSQSRSVSARGIRQSGDTLSTERKKGASPRMYASGSRATRRARSGVRAASSASGSVPKRSRTSRPVTAEKRRRASQAASSIPAARRAAVKAESFTAPLLRYRRRRYPPRQEIRHRRCPPPASGRRGAPHGQAPGNLQQGHTSRKEAPPQAARHPAHAW